MRTERFLARACVILAAAAGAFAADVTFDPSMVVNAFYDGNVRGVGETDPEATDDPSAIVGGFGFNLPLSVRTPSRDFSFSYRPRREVYDDEARPDFTSHAVAGSVARTVSERTSYSLGFDYNYSDRQELNYLDRLAQDPERPLPSQTYVERRTFQSGSLFGSGDFSAGRRSTLSWRLGARYEHGEDIPARDDLPASEFQDSRSYDAAFGWEYGYSAQGGAGVAAMVQRFDYEDTSAGAGPSVDVFSIGHTGTRRFSRDGSLSYAVGALRSDDGFDSNVSGSLNVAANWTLGPHAAISTGVRQGASAGDGISGATLDRGGYFTWSYARPRGFGASVTAAYWDRQNLNEASEAADPPSALTLSDTFSWRLGRFFRIGLFHSYYNQSSGDPLLETSYHSGGVTWTWIFRGDRGGGA